MAASKKTKTLSDAVRELRELEGRSAVMTAAVGYFRTRYLARDSGVQIATLKHLDGSPVDQQVVELVICEWEDEIREMEETLASYREQVING